MDWVSNSALNLKNLLENVLPTTNQAKFEFDAQNFYLHAMEAEFRLWDMLTEQFLPEILFANNSHHINQIYTLAVKTSILKATSFLYNRATDLIDTLPRGQNKAASNLLPGLVSIIVFRTSTALRQFKSDLKSRIDSPDFQGLNNACIPHMDELERFTREVPEWIHTLELSFTVTREDTRAAVENLNAALLQVRDQFILWTQALP